MLLFWFGALSAHAQESAVVRVAVAANFRYPMVRLADEFERASGHLLEPVFGSSGKFYAQILRGAPFDLFLSADQEKPEKLVQAGLADRKNRFTYALGALVLWSSSPGKVDSAGKVLSAGEFARLAIANPRFAPYGVASLRLLQRLGLDDIEPTRIVMGENIAQTFQFVATGGADLGLVALSQMYLSVAQGSRYWLVPEELYPPIRQGGVLLKQGQSNPAALELMEFLQSESASRIVSSSGYRLPGDP